MSCATNRKYSRLKGSSWHRDSSIMLLWTGEESLAPLARFPVRNWISSARWKALLLDIGRALLCPQELALSCLALEALLAALAISQGHYRVRTLPSKITLLRSHLKRSVTTRPHKEQESTNQFWGSQHTLRPWWRKSWPWAASDMKTSQYVRMRATPKSSPTPALTHRTLTSRLRPSLKRLNPFLRQGISLLIRSEGILTIAMQMMTLQEWIANLTQ